MGIGRNARSNWIEEVRAPRQKERFEKAERWREIGDEKEEHRVIEIPLPAEQLSLLEEVPVAEEK